MIKNILINKLFSFNHSSTELNDKVNILVGINGSGKSNLIKAIQLLFEGVSGAGLEKYIIDTLGGFDNIFFASNEKKREEIEIEYTFNPDKLKSYGFQFKDDVIYSIRLIKIPGGTYRTEEKIVAKKDQGDDGFVYLDFKSGSGVLNELSTEDQPAKKTKLVKYEHFVGPGELALSKIYDSERYFALNTIRKAVSDIIVYEYFDTTRRSAIRKPMLPTSEKKLMPDGSNLPQILNTIKINNKENYKRILDKLRDVNPKFRSIDFNFIGGNIELMLEEESINKSIHVSNISDGTLRFLCLLAVLFNPNRGTLVCLEEPELGLHPDMIATICMAIKEASEKTQFIISTHSELILNQFELSNLKIFEKDAENSTTISSQSEDDFKGWYDSFAVGSMWRQGDLGGNRW